MKRGWLVVPTVATVLTVGALSGCGGDDLQGTVASKQLQPGYTYIYMQPIYTTRCSGQPAVCSQVLTGMIPIPMSVPPCYQLTVKGKTPGETCIDPAQWDATKVGDHYTGPDVDPKDRQVAAS